MGIVEKFIKEGQLTKEEYPELLRLYQDVDAVRLLREEAVRIQKKYFGNKVFRTVIPRSVKLSEAPSFGEPILTYAPKSKGAEAYKKLCREVIKRV